MPMNKRDIQVLVRGYKNFKNGFIKLLEGTWVKTCVEFIWELLFPNTCLLCQRLSHMDICEQCIERHPISNKPRCMNCGKFILQEEKELCIQCSEKRFYFDRGASLWLHDKQVKRAIYRFKYSNYRVYGRNFAKIIVNNHKDKIILWKPDCIMAVPVHKNRLKSRGYNQAEVLALDIVEEIRDQIGVKLPYIGDMVIRNKNTTVQKLLNSDKRMSNIQGAFQLNKHYSIPERVLLIDDIYTTGATLNEVAKILKKSGVKEVCFLTISIGQGI